MKKLTTKNDMICAFLAYMNSRSIKMIEFKSIELAHLRSKFYDLKIRCHYVEDVVIFTTENVEEGITVDNNISIMALRNRLKVNPVLIEQDLILLFCLVILREPERKLIIKRAEIEKARLQGRVKFRLDHFKAEDAFVLKYRPEILKRKRRLILSGAN